jgi:predicted dehydrogenase
MAVVSVFTPAHRQVVEYMLASGKHVYCEWPLGVTTTEAEYLAALADAASVQHMVGLQGFDAPGALAVAKLIRSGAIGKVCAASFVGSGGPLGPVTRASLAYALDQEAGTSVLTAHTAHWIATIETVLGPLTSLTGLAVTANEYVVLEGSTEPRRVSAPDQVAFAGRLGGNGALFSFVAQSGVANAAYNFELKIVGT